MGEVVVYFFDVSFNGRNLLVGFIGIEFQDTSHFYLHQFENVVPVDFTQEVFFERFQPPVDMGYGIIHRPAFLKCLVFVYPFFDENFFKGEEM